MYIYTHMHNYIYVLRIYTHARTHICVDHCQGKSKTTEPSAGSYRLDSDTEGLGSKDGGFKVNASAGLHKGAVHKVLCSWFFKDLTNLFVFGLYGVSRIEWRFVVVWLWHSAGHRLNCSMLRLSPF